MQQFYYIIPAKVRKKQFILTAIERLGAQTNNR